MIITKRADGAVVIGLTKAEVDTAIRRGTVEVNQENFPAIIDKGTNIVLMFAADAEGLRAQIEGRAPGSSRKAH